ncbi:MAG: hypothetical protein WCG27_04045, partial [Pseudomonadota bacterium]
DRNNTLKSISYIDGLGNTVANQLIDQEQSFYSNWSLFDVDGNTLNQYASLRSNSSFQELTGNTLRSTKYDHLSRPVELRDNVYNRLDSYSYANGKIFHNINNMAYSNKEDSARNVFSKAEYADGQTVSAFIEANGQIKRLNHLFYKWDLDGNVTEVATDPAKKNVVFKQEVGSNSVLLYDLEKWFIGDFGRPSAIWQKDQKVADFSYDSFGRLQGMSYDLENSSIQVQYNVDDTIKNRTLQHQHQTVNQELSYNFMQNLTAEKINFNGNSFRYDYAWQLGRIKSLRPLISDSTYDEHGHLDSITFANNLKYSYVNNPHGAIKEISVTRDGKMLWWQSTTYNSFSRINDEKDNIHPQNILSNKSRQYNDALKTIESPRLAATIARDNYGRLSAPDLSYLENGLPFLKSIGPKAIHSGALGNILGVGDEYYLTPEWHRIGNIFVRYFYAGIQKIAVEIFEGNQHEFYPLLTDVRGSIRAILDSQGNALAIRDYSTWGELTKEWVNGEKGAKINKLVRYDFAGLIRPYKSSYLLSGTRVYSPAHGQWITYDIKLLVRPSFYLKSHLTETDGFSYAAGDPVNLIDPSGEAGIFAAIGVGALMGGIMGGMIAHMTHTDVLKGVAKGALLGAVAPVGAALIGGALGAGGMVFGVSVGVDLTVFGKSPTDLTVYVNAIVSAVFAGLGTAVKAPVESTTNLVEQVAIKGAVDLFASSPTKVAAGLIMSNQSKNQGSQQNAQTGNSSSSFESINKSSEFSDSMGNNSCHDNVSFDGGFKGDSNSSKNSEGMAHSPKDETKQN